MLCLAKLKLAVVNVDLYKQALTHASASEVHNERLEFLGDAVLELVASEYLYNQFDLSEGDMTKLRSSLVCTDALIIYANYLELENDLVVGESLKNNIHQNKKIIANAVEALIAAIYLDLGYDTAKQVILELFTLNDHSYQDYKTTLQELVQTTKNSVTYRTLSESGPAHNKRFTIAVIIDNIVYGQATAKSKKEAEQLAAKSALDKKAGQ